MSTLFQREQLIRYHASSFHAREPCRVITEKKFGENFHLYCPLLSLAKFLSCKVFVRC